MSDLFKTILCPINFDQSSSAVIETAANLLERPNGRLYLLHAKSFEFALSDQEATLAMSEVRRRIAALARKHLGSEIRYEILAEKSDDAAKSILEAARRLSPGCVIMSTHARRGIGRFLLGSVAARAVRESSRPVITIRPEATSTRTATHDEKLSAHLTARH